MALKAKKKVEEEIVETEVVDTVSNSVLTEDEKEAIKNDEEKREEEGADVKRLKLATNVVSSKFNLDPNYKVCKFDDKGKVVNLTLESNDFIVAVTIKDSYKHNINVD